MFFIDWSKTRPVTHDPIARLAAFQSARPRPWRTGSRHTNRNIRRALALAAGRKSLAAESRRYSRDMARLERLNEAVRQRTLGRLA